MPHFFLNNAFPKSTILFKQGRRRFKRMIGLFYIVKRPSTTCWIWIVTSSLPLNAWSISICTKLMEFELVWIFFVLHHVVIRNLDCNGLTLLIALYGQHFPIKTKWGKRDTISNKTSSKLVNKNVFLWFFFCIGECWPDWK